MPKRRRTPAPRPPTPPDEMTEEEVAQRLEGSTLVVGIQLEMTVHDGIIAARSIIGARGSPILEAAFIANAAVFAPLTGQAMRMLGQVLGIPEAKVEEGMIDPHDVADLAMPTLITPNPRVGRA